MRTDSEKIQLATAYLERMGFRVVEKSGLWTTEQAAEYLNTAPATLAVWRSTNRRILPYVKVGSNVRYRREDLDKFIAANLCNGEATDGIPN